MTFSVTHEGRGGTLRCQGAAGEVLLPIEMLAGGAFSVWLRGVRLTKPGGRTRRLSADERRDLHTALRAWLDDSGRQSWVIET